MFYHFVYTCSPCSLISLHKSIQLIESNKQWLAAPIRPQQFPSDCAAVWFMNSSGERSIEAAEVSRSGQQGYRGQVKSSLSGPWGSWPLGQRGKWSNITHDLNWRLNKDGGQLWLKCVRCLMPQTRFELTISSTVKRISAPIVTPFMFISLSNVNKSTLSPPKMWLSNTYCFITALILLIMTPHNSYTVCNGLLALCYEDK